MAPTATAAATETGVRSLAGGKMKKLTIRHLQELRPIAADTFVAAALVAALYLTFDGLALLLSR